MALVVTLSLIVLATIAVMAFFARAMFNRNVEASRTSQVMATQVADSAVDYIVGEFLLEISANSTVYVDNGIPIYLPKLVTNAVPRRSIATGIPGTDPNFYNLIRQSIPGADANASTIDTTTASRNGRSVGTANWNSPRLVIGSGFVSSNQLPNWIYLNPDGSVTGTPTSNTLGRFAYNVYDEGGLLDVNVAGYPSGVSGTPLAILKGALAGADLSAIPDIANAATMNAFVQWRNVASAGSSASYVNGVTNAATNGFLQAQPGDNRILSRQDLIKLAQNGSYGITTAALPYLTTFTRALNAPSWSPSTPNDSSIDYAALANSGTNRFLPNVRVTSSFIRADGTIPKLGEPLLKTRFPLSRLLGLGRNGVNGTGDTTLLNGTLSPATAATIQRDFGLVWSGDRWAYAGPSGSGALNSISTLDSITNREPNFFELLKASILSGSLGKGFGDTQISSLAMDKNGDNQIIQIGLNIIDQYDANSYPTRVVFNSNDFAGIENLPYLTRVFSKFYRSTADPAVNRAYYMAEVWNPHRPKTNADGPTRFRFAAQGQSMIYCGSVEDENRPYLGNTKPGLDGPSVAPNGMKNIAGIVHSIGDSGTPEFGNNAINPTLLLQGNGAIASGDNSVSDGSVAFVGIYAGKIAVTDVIAGTPDWTGNGHSYGGYLTGAVDPSGAVGESFYLQFYDGAGWVTYQAWDANGWRGMWDGNANGKPGATLQPQLYTGGVDPRSSRFGIIGGVSESSMAAPAWADLTSTTSPQAIYNTLRPAYSAKGAFLYVGAPATLEAGWGPSVLPSDPNGPQYYFGTLAENKTTLANGTASPLYYRDNDGILRNGDAAYASGAWGQPLELSNVARGLASRPMVLDRPFRSVAEMGYAFRDLPYKSIDFFTANSADAALLDTFCLNESPVSGMSAGVLNLNTRQKPVLKAVLTGALKDELDAASTLTAATEADAMATAIINATATTPLLNRADLATKIAPALAAGNFANNPADAAIKARREAVVRALADVGNTRTWNLMVDVIAQAGRFAPGSATGAGDFIVEGEQRYWLHVALDRYTGKVISQSLETINE